MSAHVSIAIWRVRSTIRWVFQSFRYCSIVMSRYSEIWLTYSSRSASFRRIRSLSTTAVPAGQEAVLEDAEVEELAEREGLEAVAAGRGPGAGHPPGLGHPAP